MNMLRGSIIIFLLSISPVMADVLAAIDSEVPQAKIDIIVAKFLEDGIQLIFTTYHDAEKEYLVTAFRQDQLKKELTEEDIVKLSKQIKDDRVRIALPDDPAETLKEWGLESGPIDQ